MLDIKHMWVLMRSAESGIQNAEDTIYMSMQSIYNSLSGGWRIRNREHSFIKRYAAQVIKPHHLFENNMCCSISDTPQGIQKKKKTFSKVFANMPV